MVLLSTASIAAEQEEARFVSLTPDIFREADASEIMDNVEALGGAQFFWAFPEQGSKGNLHLPSLVGAKMGIVHPYQITEKEEKEGKEIRFCWGRLENLLYTSEIPKEAEYWVRPTTSLFAIQSPCRYDEKQEKGKKLHLNFRDYHYFLDANKGNKDSFASVYNTMGEHEKKAMNIQDPFRGKPKGENDKPGMYGNLDFNSCPWGDMLERKKTKVNESADIKYVTDHLTSLANLAKEKKLDKNSKWMNYWGVTIGAGSRRDYGKRKELLLYWRDEPYQILNKTKGSFDGWLCLKDYTTFKWDCAKIEQAGTSFNFLPLSGHVAKFSASGTIEQKPDRELRAVIASSTKAKSRKPCFLVAVLADWDRSGSREDAITINKDFNPSGGWLGHGVRVPEFSRVALSPEQLTSSGHGYLHTEFHEKDLKARVTWKGGTELCLVDDMETSHVAYPAGSTRRIIKAVVALPAESQDETGKVWSISAVAEHFEEGTIKAFSDGANPPEDWAPCKPKDMGMDWKMCSMSKFASGLTVIAGNQGDKPERLENYDLFLVELEAEDPVDSRIASGEMHMEWLFRRRLKTETDNKKLELFDEPLERASMRLDKVYTIFGDSTWDKSGEVASISPSIKDAILPWPRLLNYLTRLCLCDDNPYVKQVVRNNTPRKYANALAAMAHGVNKTSVYSQAKDKNKHPADVTLSTSTYNNDNNMPEYENLLLTCSGFSLYESSLDYDRFVHFDLENFLQDIEDGEGNTIANSYMTRVREIICVDASLVLSIVPRICGFPEIIYHIVLAPSEDSSLGHEFNSFNAMADTGERFKPHNEEDNAYSYLSGEKAYDAFYYDATPESDKECGAWNIISPELYGTQEVREFLKDQLPVEEDLKSEEDSVNIPRTTSSSFIHIGTHIITQKTEK